MTVKFPFDFDYVSESYYGKIYRPVAKVSFQSPKRNTWTTAWMIVDIGADFTILPNYIAKDLDITFDKGMLWIKGEAKEEEKQKKFYRRLASTFSYRVAVPGEIDLDKEPEVSCKNGVVKVTFAKAPKAQPIKNG